MQILSFSTIVFFSLTILISFAVGSRILVNEDKKLHHTIKK